MGFTETLSHAARLYGGMTLGCALPVFIGVEGRRGIEYLGALAGVSATAAVRIAIATAYIVIAPTCLVRRAGDPQRAYQYLAAGLTVLLSTGVLYGFLAFIGKLIPNLPDPLFVTCLAMSALLGACLMFHRRTHR